MLYREILDESTLQPFPKIWEQKLVVAGYRRIGHGRYAHVWAKRGDPFVLKVFQYDPAYSDFIRLISDHQDNLHFPRIKGHLTRLDDVWQAVRIERLTRLAPAIMVDQMLHYRAAHNTKLETPRRDTLQSYLDEMDRTYQEFRQEYPQLAAALDLIFTTLCDTGQCGIDLATEGNVRMRGGVVVISDPVFDRAMRT